MEDVISLREFIDDRENITSVKANTFCRLMKHVCDAIEKEERHLIKINLNDIKMNIKTGEIILGDDLFNDDENSKTIADLNTGISVMADRKSSVEHKRVSFALMVLGWYANLDHSAIISDLEVLDNFDTYMEKVPLWLQQFFISVFRNMDYTSSFSDYYDENFTEKVKKQIDDAFSEYNLNDETKEKVYKLVAKTTNKIMKEGALDG